MRKSNIVVEGNLEDCWELSLPELHFDVMLIIFLYL